MPSLLYRTEIWYEYYVTGIKWPYVNISGYMLQKTSEKSIPYGFAMYYACYMAIVKN
jgi:hypothetical protein